jgi:hypothetical protein
MTISRSDRRLVRSRGSAMCSMASGEGLGEGKKSKFRMDARQGDDGESEPAKSIPDDRALLGVLGVPSVRMRLEEGEEVMLICEWRQARR